MSGKDQIKTDASAIATLRVSDLVQLAIRQTTVGVRGTESTIERDERLQCVDVKLVLRMSWWGRWCFHDAALRARFYALLSMSDLRDELVILHITVKP